MSSNLVTAQTGAAFTQDPSITLLNYIKNNWVIADPPVADINFDTKLARFDKHLHVIVENMPELVRQQVLGAGRFRITDTKRVQLRGDRPTAKDKIWKMKERIEAIINANPLGMQSNGIDFAFVVDYQDVIEAPQGDATNETVTYGLMVGRFLVEMTYDKVKV